MSLPNEVTFRIDLDEVIRQVGAHTLLRRIAELGTVFARSEDDDPVTWQFFTDEGARYVAC